MTKRFSKTAKPRREPPAELVEWTAACQEYCDKRLAGPVTEAHRAKRARRGSPSRTPFTLELMDEIMRPLQ